MNKAQKLLESLTPGGSEFVDDPEYCVKYVKEFEADQHKKIIELITEKNRLVEQKSKLFTVLTNLIQNVESLNGIADLPIMKMLISKGKDAIKNAAE